VVGRFSRESVIGRGGPKNRIMKWEKNNFPNFNDSGWVKKKKTKGIPRGGGGNEKVRDSQRIRRSKIW
jgi:hypothetical protein